MDKATLERIKAIQGGYDASLSGHLLSGVKTGKTSRYRGVYKKAEKDKWVAQIKEPGKKYQTHLGTFDREESAALAYNMAAKAIYGESAYQNRIGDNNERR